MTFVTPPSPGAKASPRMRLSGRRSDWLEDVLGALPNERQLPQYRQRDDVEAGDLGLVLVLSRCVTRAVTLPTRQVFGKRKRTWSRKLHSVFVTGYEDWFMPSDLDDVPVERKPSDPENVIRGLFRVRRPRGQRKLAMRQKVFRRSFDGARQSVRIGIAREDGPFGRWRTVCSSMPPEKHPRHDPVAFDEVVQRASHVERKQYQYHVPDKDMDTTGAA